MTTDALIRLLIANDVKLITLPGGQLDVNGPDGALTPALVEALRRHKPTLLRRMAALERDRPEPASRRWLELLIAGEANAPPE